MGGRFTGALKLFSRGPHFVLDISRAVADNLFMTTRTREAILTHDDNRVRTVAEYRAALIAHSLAGGWTLAEAEEHASKAEAMHAYATERRAVVEAKAGLRIVASVREAVEGRFGRITGLY